MDLHDVFMLSYAATFWRFDLQMEKFVPVLLTLTRTESSDGKRQKSAGQFYGRGIFKFPCICDLNGAIIAM